MNICEFGCNSEALFFFRTTKRWCCSKSVNSCRGKREKDSINKLGKPIVYKDGQAHPRLGQSPPIAGKTYDSYFGKEKSQRIKAKISTSNIECNKISSGWDKMSDESKSNIRNGARRSLLNRYREGWNPRAGRCKKIKYTSEIAGEVSLDGSWELLTARYLDLIKVQWTRNTKRFSYVNLENKISSYTPDFWVKDWNSYIEVKGYERPEDKCKWNQFPENLIIWKKDKMEEIKKMTL